MAIDFLVSADLNRNELLNARLQNLGTDPTGLTADDKGLIWVNASGSIKYWDGTTTQTLGLSTGGDASTLNSQNGAYYLSRANHTGTQVATTISDLPETVQDLIGAMLSGTQTGITVTYNDAAATLAFTVTDSPTVGGATPAQLRDRTTHTGTQASTTISDFAEAVSDQVGAMVSTNTETGITVTYQDTDNTLDFAVTDSPTVGGATPAQLRDRSTHTGTQAISTVTGLQTALDGKADDGEITALDGRLDTAEATLLGLGTAATEDAATFEQVANKGVANGYASLDGTGKVPSAQLPALALTDVHVVADVAARDALTVQEGDVAIVTGVDNSYIYDGTAWQEITSPTDGVTAVTGGTGITSSGGTTPAISITAGGVGTTQLADNSVTTGKMADGSVELNTATTTGTLPISKGGTGATDAAGIRTAIAATTKFSVDVGGAGTEYVVTHNLNTRDVQVQVFRNSTPWDTVQVDVERTTVNTVTVRFAQTQTAAAFRCVVTG